MRQQVPEDNDLNDIQVRDKWEYLGSDGGLNELNKSSGFLNEQARRKGGDIFNIYYRYILNIIIFQW